LEGYVTTAEHVAAVDLFAGLSQHQAEALASIATLNSWGKGEVVFLAGQEASGFYAVARGRVRVFKTSPTGKEHILHVFGPGQAFGEVAVFSGINYPADAQVMEPSELLFFPRDRFRSLLGRDPDLAMSVIGLLSQRLRTFVRKIEELSLKEVPARLAAHLCLLAAGGPGRTVQLDLPKGQLAAYLGTIPETLSRMLKKLAEEGIIEMEGSRVTILDPERLEELAGQGR
jgi:CRP/FNR family transcriptional regulator